MQAPRLSVKYLGYLGLCLVLLNCLALAVSFKWASNHLRQAKPSVTHQVTNGTRVATINHQANSTPANLTQGQPAGSSLRQRPQLQPQQGNDDKEPSNLGLPAGIYRSPNGGRAWANIYASPDNAGTNKDARVGVTPADPQRIYGYLGSGTWSAVNNGLPPVSVHKLAAQARGLIQAATYGRGAYELNPAATCPMVTSIAPTSGPIGISVTIKGSGFTDLTAVRFNTAFSFFNVLDDATILASVPNGATTGPITLSKTGCANVQTPTFTVTPTCPVALSISPSSGPIGTSVTISGGNFTGVSSVKFAGNVTASFSVPNSSTILTTVPNGAVNGPITISKSGCSDEHRTSFTITAGSNSISGTVNYGTSTTPKPVLGVTLTAAGAPAATNTTDNAGNYNLTNLGAGPYTVTPSKTGSANGISSFDASLVAQHVTGLMALSPNQQIAADASGNGQITSFDASLIAQAAAGMPNNGLTGTWKFVPSSRNYLTLSGNLTGQNYDAILVGEVSGNWTPPGGPEPPQRQAAPESRALVLPETDSSPSTNTRPTEVALQAISGVSGASVTIPMTVGDLSGLKVTAYDLILSFDPSVLQLSGVPTETSGTLSEHLKVTINSTLPGKVIISAFGMAPLTGAGTLLNLRFEVIGAAGSSSALSWEAVTFNEGEVSVKLVDSNFTVNDSGSEPRAVASVVPASNQRWTQRSLPLAVLIQPIPIAITH